jgi:hypothetical protein
VTSKIGRQRRIDFDLLQRHRQVESSSAVPADQPHRARRPSVEAVIVGTPAFAGRLAGVLNG